MISGFFDPFHFGHLEFIKEAARLGSYLIVIVSSDKQALMKKGRINEPLEYRAEILDLVLRGLEIEHQVYINIFDKETTFVAQALRKLKPTIFCRGSDKTLEDMPLEEKTVCDELGIQIVHIQSPVQAHSSEFV